MTPFQESTHRRNEKIVAALKAGSSVADLAQTFNLCRSRISQIGHAGGIMKKVSHRESSCEKIRLARLAAAAKKRRENPQTDEQRIRSLRYQVWTLKRQIAGLNPQRKGGEV